MTKKVNWNREELMELYYDKQMSAFEIGELKNITPSAVYEAMKVFKIERRNKSDAMKLAYQRGRRPIIYLPIQLGEDHHAWRGGRLTRANGYVYVYHPGHPRGVDFQKKYVAEHILVWERVHGKFLPEGYVIHHLNGIKGDNRSENLVAFPKGKHHAYLVRQELQKKIRELEQRIEKLIYKSDATEDAIRELEEQGITPIIVEEKEVK